MTKRQYRVEIVEDETGEVVHTSKLLGYRAADRLEDGYGINLDWEHFSTRIVDVETSEEVKDTPV